MKLSDNLKRIRKDNNLSQEQLAEKLGVSRQAVSKWESGQSYPEMDKVLLICKLFNYNIDELMNENIKEVEETKQSKININKYIDDFFGFITKTVDMFSSMKLSEKFKCLMEQLIIGTCLFFVFLIIGAIGGSVLIGILGKLSIYYIIRDILESVYIVFALVVGVTILLHIFKVRYLDYYEVGKEDTDQDKIEGSKIEEKNNDSQKQVISNDKIKIFLGKKKEKIVIRDPNHSQSKFLTGIFQIILWFMKFIAICIALWFVATFVSLFCLLVLSFLFIKTGLIFIGTLICIISAIIINFVILEWFYNFIVSKKSKKTRMAISFLISLVLAGISIGLILVGITDFKIGVNNEIEEVHVFQMSENLSIDNWYNMEYIEENSDEIKIVIKHSDFFTANVTNQNETIQIYFYQDNAEIMEGIKKTINDINNKEIKDYYNPIIQVYASKDNIEKLRQNKQIKYNQSQEEHINELHDSIAEKDNEIIELQNQLVDKDTMIDSLEIEIQNKEFENTELQDEIQEKENTINSLEQQIIMSE